MTVPVRWLLVAGVLFVLAAGGGAWIGVVSEGDDEAPGSTDLLCWDGTTAPSAARCPLPTGIEGMMTVFPSLRSDCVTRATVEGKTEIHACESPGLVIRYSRFESYVDRIAYYEQANPDAFLLAWDVGGVPAGVQWTSREERPGEGQPWQWSATYTGHPYGVSVEGVTLADRKRGITLVQARPPDEIGLALTP